MKILDGLWEEIACIRREIHMRKRVYPNWIASGKMSQQKADHEIAVMTRIHDKLSLLYGFADQEHMHHQQLELGSPEYENP